MKKTITYTITVKKDTDIITKSYKNRLTPYAKRKGFNNKSLENLRYKNKHNDFFMNVNFNADSFENSTDNSILSLDKYRTSIDIFDREDSKYSRKELNENNIINNEENEIYTNIDLHKEEQDDKYSKNIDEIKINSCDDCYLFKQFIEGINSDYLEKFNNICNIVCFFNSNIECLIDIDQEQYKIFHDKISGINNKNYNFENIIETINTYNVFKKDFGDKIKVICKELNTNILSNYEYIKKYNNDVLLEIS